MSLTYLFKVTAGLAAGHSETWLLLLLSTLLAGFNLRHTTDLLATRLAYLLGTDIFIKTKQNKTSKEQNGDVKN